MRELAVVAATLASLIAGAFQQPWWTPLALVPAAGWGYAQVVSQAHRLAKATPGRYAEALVSQAVNLYLAFGTGWLVATLFG